MNKSHAITMVGGPKDQRTYKYPRPYPDSVEFHDPARGASDVYYRKPYSRHYIHADDVPPEWKQT